MRAANGLPGGCCGEVNRLDDADPSTAVAYALRSLELDDAGEARLFALEALQRGPTTLTHDLGELAGQAQALTVAFSRDGRWIVSGDWEGNVVLCREVVPTPFTAGAPEVLFEGNFFHNLRRRTYDITPEVTPVGEIRTGLRAVDDAGGS